MANGKMKTPALNVKKAGEKTATRMAGKVHELDEKFSKMVKDTGWQVDKMMGKLSATGKEIASTSGDIGTSVKKAVVDSGKSIARTTGDIGKNVSKAVVDSGKSIAHTTGDIGTSVKKAVVDSGKSIARTSGDIGKNVKKAVVDSGKSVSGLAKKTLKRGKY